MSSLTQQLPYPYISTSLRKALSQDEQQRTPQKAPRMAAPPFALDTCGARTMDALAAMHTQLAEGGLLGGWEEGG